MKTDHHREKRLASRPTTQKEGVRSSVHSWYEQEFDTEEEMEAPESVSIQRREDERIIVYGNGEKTRGKRDHEDDDKVRRLLHFEENNALNDADGKFERFLENVKRAKRKAKT